MLIGFFCRKLPLWRPVLAIYSKLFLVIKDVVSALGFLNSHRFMTVLHCACLGCVYNGLWACSTRVLTEKMFDARNKIPLCLMGHKHQSQSDAYCLDAFLSIQSSCKCLWLRDIFCLKFDFTHTGNLSYDFDTKHCHECVLYLSFYHIYTLIQICMNVEWND